VIHLCGKLSSTGKGGDQSCAAYFVLMKGYADEMGAAGKRLDDDDIVSYILSGLDAEYNPIVESICAKTELTSLSDLYAQMLSTEARLDAQNSLQVMTTNAVTRGNGHGGFERGDGGRGDNSHGRGGGCGNSRPRDQWQAWPRRGALMEAL
jgi:hypothetical protein